MSSAHWLSSVPMFVGVQNVHPGAQVSIRQGNVVVNVVESGEKSRLCWLCARCGMKNAEECRHCRRLRCFGTRPGRASELWVLSGAFIVPWYCEVCGTCNAPNEKICDKCRLKEGTPLHPTPTLPRSWFDPKCRICERSLRHTSDPVATGLTHVFYCSCTGPIEWTASPDVGDD